MNNTTVNETFVGNATKLHQSSSYIPQTDSSWFVYPLILLAPICLTPNIYAVSVLLKFPRLRRQKSNLFLICLFLSHALSYVFLLALATYRHYHGNGNLPFDDLGILILEVLLGFSVLFSMTSLMLVNLIKIVIIWKPLHYERLRHVHYVIPIVIALIVSVAGAFSEKYFSRKKMVQFTTLKSEAFQAACQILFQVNLHLFLQVRRQLKNIRKLTVTSSEQQKEREEQRLKRRERRSLLVCLLWIFSFIVLTLPEMVVATTRISDKYTVATGDFVLLREMHSAFLLLACMNSVADPLTYFMMNKEVRGYLKWLRFLKKKTVDPKHLQSNNELQQTCTSQIQS